MGGRIPNAILFPFTDGIGEHGFLFKEKEDLGKIFSEQNIPKAIEMFRESVAMGYEPAFINLRAALYELSPSYIQGIKGCKKNKFKAIESLRESLSLGYKPAQEILSLMLNNYAIEIANGSKKEDILKAIKLAQESVCLGYEPARKT